MSLPLQMKTGFSPPPAAECGNPPQIGQPYRTARGRRSQASQALFKPAEHGRPWPTLLGSAPHWLLPNSRSKPHASFLSPKTSGTWQRLNGSVESGEKLQRKCSRKKSTQSPNVSGAQPMLERFQSYFTKARRTRDHLRT